MKMSNSAQIKPQYATLQQALDSAIAMMKSDDAISSVEIEFEANGRLYHATYSGIVRNVRRAE
jgi:hypothetical protein